MALIYYCPKLVINQATGQPVEGLDNGSVVGQIAAQGNASSVPEIFEDKAGTAIIAGSNLTITQKKFVRAFYIDEEFGPVSLWAGGDEFPLETTEGFPILLRDFRDELNGRMDGVEATAASAVGDAEASRVAAEAAQAAAEALEAGTADWSQIQNKPTTFAPAAHNHAGSDITTGTINPARLTGVVKTVNGNSPDSAGNITVSTGGGPGGGAVSSVAGKTGDVSLVKADVGLSNVNNTADADKPVSTLQASALNGKAPTVHTHTTAQVTGLAAELASKRGQNDPVDASLLVGVIAPVRQGTGAVGSPTASLKGDGVFREDTGGGGSGEAGLPNQVAVYGDSQVSNDTLYGGTKRFGQLLAEALGGVTVHEEGYGGADSPSIAGMAGAIPTAVTLTGGQVPTVGGVAIEDFVPNDALQGEYEANYGWLAGKTGERVYGYISGWATPGGPRTFNRAAPGTAVPVHDDTMFIPERAQHAGCAAIMLSGGNDPGHGVSESRRQQAFDAFATRWAPAFLVISSVPTPSASATLYETTETYLAGKYGPNYLNARLFLNEHGLEWAGLTPTSDDLDDISAGKVPRQLFHTDNIHLNEYGRRALAKKVGQVLTSMGHIVAGSVTAPTDSVKPSTPGTPTSSAITSAGCTLTWTGSTDNVGVAGYNVYRGGSLYTTTSGALSVAITGLSPSTPYTWTIRARDAAGNLSDASGSHSMTTGASSDAVPPSVPGLPVASDETPTSFVVTWPASTDNVGVTSYDVQVNGSSYPAAWAVTAPATTITVTGLTPDTDYTVRVRARDAAGNPSALSTALTASTLPSGSGSGEFPIEDVAFRYVVEENVSDGSGVIRFENQGTATGDLWRYGAANLGASIVTAHSHDWASQATTFAPSTAYNTRVYNDIRSFAAVFYINRTIGDTAFYKMFQIREEATDEQWEGYIGGNDVKWSARGDAGDETISDADTGGNAPVVLVVTFSGGTGDVKMWVNGTAHSSGSTTWSDVTVAKWLTVHPGNAVRWGELALDDVEWTSGEVADISAHLMTKYDIA